MTIDLNRLKEPFPIEDIEWMITNGSVTKKGSTIRAKCLAYVTARAIMERLDDVCGPDGWRNEFREGPAGGVLCGIAIRIGDEWVTKWDGAENTDIEAVKGGLSGAMKRAGAQWGIGRYLYYLPEHWAIVGTSGRYWYGGNARDGKEKVRVTFNWTNPALPKWALPGGSGRPGSEEINDETGEVANSQFPCPICKSPVFDHREKKAGTNVISSRMPDLSCSSPSCKDPNTNRPWAVWMDTWLNDMLAEIDAAYGAELIDLQEQDNAEKLVRAGTNIRVLLKIQARLNDLAEGA